jgi:hypothetical protein
MSKVSYTALTSGYNLAQINANFKAIVDVINGNVFFRNNTSGEDNALYTTLDANGKRIINLPAPASSNEPARLIDVQNAISGAPVWGTITGSISSQSDLQAALSAKQNTLVAGSNLKTINGNSLLGSGDLTIASGGGSGTVTSVSVASANGFYGTVSTSTTTPAININTSVVGMLKGSVGALVQAVSGTDFAPPTTGSSILYANGAGGFSSVTIGSGLTFASGTLTATGGGTGTVTTVSVASANGFAGSVTNATTTPAITLTTSITGLLKGSSSALVAATAGTDFVAPATATTFTAKQTFNGSSSAPATSLINAAEPVLVTASVPSSTFYVASGAVQLFTTAATANWTINFAFSSGTSLNTAMAIGDSVTVVQLSTQGTTAYYPTTFSVDGTAVTPKWLGGTAPSAGNASGVDAYSFTIIKTASATYTVLASQSQYK